MKNLLTGIILVFVVVGVLAVSYLAWQLGRQWNYKFSYKNMVAQTVVEMVKPEALRSK